MARAAVSSEATGRALRAPAGWARAIAGWSVWGRLLHAPASLARNLRDPLVRWVPRLLVALVIVGIGTVGMRYVPSMLKTLSERTPSATP